MLRDRESMLGATDRRTRNSHLSQVDGSDLVLVQKFRAVDKNYTTEIPLLAFGGLIRGTLGLGKADQSLDEELAGVAFLAILGYSAEDDRGRDAGLNGGKLCRGEKL